MKRRTSILIMIGLVVLVILSMCSYVSADAVATFIGRVRPIGTTGTVIVSGGGGQGSSPIGLSGFYSVTIQLKFQGYSCTVTAETNRGTESKTVDNVNGGTYIINFNFGGGIFSMPQSSSSSNLQIFNLINIITQIKSNNPTSSDQSASSSLPIFNFLNKIAQIKSSNPTSIGQNTIEN